MITDQLVKQVAGQGFDESLFCDAASFLFQSEFGVNRYNEPKDCTREQEDWAQAYIMQYDGEEGWYYSSLEEGMSQDLDEAKGQ